MSSRLSHTVANGLIQLALPILHRTVWRPFERACKQPQSTQLQLLRQILHQQRKSLFGQAHGFAQLRSYRDFAQAVPIHTYDDLHPWFQRQLAGEKSLVTARPQHYTQTSGTTGQPKYLPVLPDTLRRYRRTARLFGVALRHQPELLRGSVLTIGSPLVEGELPGGATYGAMSGLLLASAPWPLRHKSLVPPQVFGLSDYRQRYLVMAALALADPLVTALVTPNPSTLIKLAQVIDEDADRLIRVVRTGRVDLLGPLPETVSAVLRRIVSADPQRADRLTCLHAGSGTMPLAQVWPELRGLICWTSGSCGAQLPGLLARLPPDIQVIELGYLASEFQGTVTVDPTASGGAPTLQDQFFEFIAVDDWHRGRRNCLTLEALRQGHQYYIIVTSTTGLYRYFINDVVQVTGHFHACPTLRFVQKGRGVTNLTGEKLYEDHLIGALAQTVPDGGIDFALMVADETTMSYTLYLAAKVLPKAFITRFEAALARRNLEFKSKRDSGRLHATRLVRLQAQVAEAYKQHGLANGQREGQYKYLMVLMADSLEFDFSPYRLTE